MDGRTDGGAVDGPIRGSGEVTSVDGPCLRCGELKIHPRLFANHHGS